jgi:hypothetical protein
MLKLFVSGNSRERDVVGPYIKRLTLTPGVLITLDWVAVMNSVSTPDPELTADERWKYASADLHAINEAHVVWLLIPSSEKPTIGAWIEYGYALGCGKRIVVSGDERRSLFTARAHLLCATHEEAYMQLIDLARRKQVGTTGIPEPVVVTVRETVGVTIK